jgi:hypothetical protein
MAAAVIILQAAGRLCRLIRRGNGLIVPLAVNGINNNMEAWCHVTRRIVISHGGRNLETDKSVTCRSSEAWQIHGPDESAKDCSRTRCSIVCSVIPMAPGWS